MSTLNASLNAAMNTTVNTLNTTANTAASTMNTKMNAAANTVTTAMSAENLKAQLDNIKNLKLPTNLSGKKKLREDLLRKEEMRRRAEEAVREELAAKAEKETRNAGEGTGLPQNSTPPQSTGFWHSLIAPCSNLGAKPALPGMSATSAYQPGMEAMELVNKVRDEQKRYASVMATREKIMEAKDVMKKAAEKDIKEIEKQDEEELERKFKELKEKRLSRLENPVRKSQMGSAISSLAESLETVAGKTMEATGKAVETVGKGLESTVNTAAEAAGAEGRVHFPSELTGEGKEDQEKQERIRREKEYRKSIRQSNLENRSSRRSMRWSSADLREYLPQKSKQRSIWGSSDAAEKQATSSQSRNPLNDPNRREMPWTVISSRDPNSQGAGPQEHPLTKQPQVTAEDLYVQRLIRGESGRSWRFLISMRLVATRFRSMGQGGPPETPSQTQQATPPKTPPAQDLPPGVAALTADAGDELSDDKIMEAGVSLATTSEQSEISPQVNPLMRSATKEGEFAIDMDRYKDTPATKTEFVPTNL